MGRAPRPPLTTDLGQSTEQETGESPVPPLIWPKTGSTITFRREYTARPSAVFSFACIFSGRRGRRSLYRRRGGGRTVVPLPRRRDVRIETLTLYHLHRGPTEVARIQRHRDQPAASPASSAPGAIPAWSSSPRVACAIRLGLLLVVALRRSCARQDDLAAVIDTGLGVATAIPTPVGGLHDRQVGVEVKLVWAFSAGVSTIENRASDHDTSSPVRCRWASASSRRCRSASAGDPPLGFQSLHRRLDRRQAVLPPTQVLGQLIPTPRTFKTASSTASTSWACFEQLIDLSQQWGDLLGHVAPRHRLVPQRVGLDLGPIDGDRTQAELIPPAAPAGGPGRTREQKASRSFLRVTG